jgi:anti-sigma B factor antagonist
MDLDLRVEHQDDRAIVNVGGEVDIATCPQLRDLLNELVDRGIYQLVVDLDKVSFMDSSGIGVLVGVYRRIREHGGSLRLTGPSAEVRRVLELTRVTTILPVSATLEEAAVEPHDPSPPAIVNVE